MGIALYGGDDEAVLIKMMNRFNYNVTKPSNNAHTHKKVIRLDPDSHPFEPENHVFFFSF